MDLGLSARVGLARMNKNRSWLAKQLNVTSAYAGQICNGVIEPSTPMLNDLSRIFKVDVSVFISWGER